MLYCNGFDLFQKRSSTGKNNGSITLEYYELRKIHTFLDYITGGTQINCTFAIDFTCELSVYFKDIGDYFRFSKYPLILFCLLYE